MLNSLGISASFQSYSCLYRLYWAISCSLTRPHPKRQLIWGVVALNIGIEIIMNYWWEGRGGGGGVGFLDDGFVVGDLPMFLAGDSHLKP